MSKVCARLAFLLLSVICGQGAPQAAPPLPADPRAVAGQFSNGFTWVWRRHANPPGQLALMLQVRAGSLHENDDQRGFAQLLVHLAFGETENFSAERLAAWLGSLGMETGPDVNATATFDHTSYELFLPNAEPETVETAIMLLSDIAFRLRISAEQLEKSRAAVLAELRQGRGVEQRLQDELFSRLFSESRFGRRLPIGSAETIARATPQAVEAFYRTWYRPENMSLLAVGDVGLEQLRPLVEKWFGREQPQGKLPAADGPGFRPFEQQRAIVLSDPDYLQVDVAAVSLRPGRPPATTAELAREDLVEQLAARALVRRLDQRVRRDQASYRSGSAEITRFYGQAVLATAGATSRSGKWDQMLTELLEEISRTRTYGFTDHELAVLRTELLSGTRRAAALEAQRSSQELLLEIAEKHFAGEPVLSAQQQLELLERLLPTISPVELQQALLRQLDPACCTFVVQMPQRPDVTIPGTFEVLAVARAALARRPDPPVLDPPASALLESTPTPGRVVQEARDEQLDVISLRFENGVRVHLHPMNRGSGLILVSLSLAGGRIEETAENVGISEVATLIFYQPATKRLTSTQIADLLVGRDASVEAEAGEDAVIVRLRTTPADLETGLQLLYALLTEGRLENSALAAWKEDALAKLELYRRYPEYHADAVLRELAGGGDPRLLPATAQTVSRQTSGAAQAWFDRLCREAPLEVAVVGDFEPDQLRPLLEMYLGSLPARPLGAEKLAPLRKLNRPSGPHARELRIDTDIAAARLLVGFFGCEARQVEAARHLQLAAGVADRILSQSLRERPWLHSLEVQNLPSLAYEDSGLFFVAATCPPQYVGQASLSVTQVLDELRQAGPPAEVLEAVRQDMLAELEGLLSDPDYWCDLLQTHDLHAVDLQRLRTIREDIRAYTAEQIRDTLRQYYVPQRSFRITVLPSAAQSAPGGAP